ncbi:MAG: DHA2 family efflux MFS transporter permease subunit [Alphaproteobacteria bacterium]|nr:DHA2 family efflux MFS transporter permease subunit [Alphaproteobacteria bacterium]
MTAASLPDTPAPSRSDATRLIIHRWLVVTVGLSSSLALSLSGTITNVAVPDIMGAFGVGQDQAQWMATAFFAAMTAAMLISDWLTRTFGMRTVFVVMMTVFVAGSIAGGTAQSYSIVVLGRAVQGFAAGAILPLTMMAMFSVFPPERRAMVAGLFGISFIMGPGLGPWFGGMAIDAFDWRFTFYVALPVAFISIMLSVVVFPGRDRDIPPSPLDWLGFLLVAIFLTATLTGLSNGQLKGWDSNFVVASLCLGLGPIIGFVLWELKVADPIFDIRLLRNPKFAFACLASFLVGFTMFGSFYLQPVFVQIVQNYSPLRAGLVLVPGGIAMGIALPLAGRLADKYPPSLVLATGFLVFAISTWLMGLTDANTSFWSFAVLVLLGRIGQGFLFPPVTAAGLAAAPAQKMGTANGMLNFTRQMGGAFGINLLAVNLERRTAYFSELLATTQTEANTTTQELLSTVRGMLDTAGLPNITEALVAKLYLGRVIAAQATALAFRDTFFVFAIVSFFAVGVALALWTPRRR